MLDLLEGHQFGQLVSLFGGLQKLDRRQIQPRIRCNVVLIDRIHDAEVHLRIRVALLGRQPIPAHSLGVILRHSYASHVYVAELTLRIGVALSSSQPIPADDLSRVLLDSFACRIHGAEAPLRIGVALLGSGSIPTCGLDNVRRQASLAVVVHLT